MAITKIDEYEVMYSANAFPPRIWLKGGGKYIGQLVFMPAGATLPPDCMNGTQAQLYYHLDDYHNMIDLLRNESPLYLLYVGSGPGSENGIKTTDEPVSEGEA